MSQTITGHLAVDGAPLGGVEIALLDRAGAALAATHSDAAGRFSLAPQALPAAGWVVAKLHEPLVGAAAQPLAPAAGPVALGAASRDAVSLGVAIALPPGAPPIEWFNVHVTPRALAGLPADVVGALTLDGTGPSRRGTYHTVRATGGHVRLRLQPGTYDLKVEHIVERAPSVMPGPASWIGDHLTLPDGTRRGEDLGAVRLEVTRDLEVTVTLRPFTG